MLPKIIGYAEVYETTGTKSSLLQQKTSLPITEFAGEDDVRKTVYVSSDQLYQAYIGYGASLTHASAYLLMQADEATRNEILFELFSPEGANLKVVRIPVGASDYIPGNTYFTCDDMPAGQTDPTLEHFNLDHDSDIIAVAKKIFEINPSVTFMASPWSAPAWMKTNNSLIGGAGLRRDMYEVYGDYLVKFITEYQKEGITIHSLTLVNEPGVGTLSYPTMNMNGEEAAIITAHVGSKLEALGLEVDIVAWDYNYGSSYASAADVYLEKLYGEYAETAGKYSNTVAFHGYDGDAYWNSSRKFGMKSGIEKVSRTYGKASIITEITESDVSFDFANNLSWACENIVLAPCAVQNDGKGNSWNGCGGALYWNLVLDSNGQPCPADHGACFGVISLDAQTKNGVTTYRYSKSSAYYAMAHVSKFLYDVDGVGCYAINATTDATNLYTLAFYRNDGAVVVAVLNNSRTKTQATDIVIDGRKISYNIPPQSLVTFVDDKKTQEPYTAYNFLNVEMIQTADDSYQLSCLVDCGNEDVKVYLTEKDHISATDAPVGFVKTARNETDTCLTFDTTMQVGREYFIWVVSHEKCAVLPICVPNMQPYIDVYTNGGAVLYFAFGKNISVIDFCDRNGKNIFESSSPVFDHTATPVAEAMSDSANGFRMTVNRFDTQKYYFVVLVSKNKLVRFISAPVKMVEG